MGDTEYDAAAVINLRLSSFFLRACCGASLMQCVCVCVNEPMPEFHFLALFNCVEEDCSGDNSLCREFSAILKHSVCDQSGERRANKQLRACFLPASASTWTVIL